MATFPTLSRSANIDVKEKFPDEVIRSEYEGGYAHTRPRNLRERRIFEVSYSDKNLLSSDDIALIREFIRVTTRNCADSFGWTCPDTTVTGELTVRFTKPPEIVREFPSRFSMTMEVQEV